MMSPAIRPMATVNMKSLLLLGAVLAVATAERVDLNSQVDKHLLGYNKMNLEGGKVTVPLPSMTWETGSHTGGSFGAIDSLTRTGDCFMDQTAPDSTTYEIHIGLRLLVVFLPQLTVNGDSMTAIQKVGQNSIKLLVNLRRSEDECSVEVEELALEQLDQVTNFASVSAYDKLDLSGEHLQLIQKEVNQQLDTIRPELSHYITKFVCNYGLGSNMDQTEALFQFFSVMTE